MYTPTYTPCNFTSWPEKDVFESAHAERYDVVVKRGKNCNYVTSTVKPLYDSSALRQSDKWSSFEPANNEQATVASFL